MSLALLFPWMYTDVAPPVELPAFGPRVRYSVATAAYAGEASRGAAGEARIARGVVFAADLGAGAYRDEVP